MGDKLSNINKACESGNEEKSEQFERA